MLLDHFKYQLNIKSGMIKDEVEYALIGLKKASDTERKTKG